MKRILPFLLALLLFAPAFRSLAQVRISKVYGGGGGTTSPYRRDYVEIYNSSCNPIDIGGWVLEYGSATGNWGSAVGNIFTFPAGTVIQPKKYLSVVCGANGTVGTDVPTTDLATTTSGFSMSSASGKVALFNQPNSNLACGSEIPGTLVDKVAYGLSNCAENTAISGSFIINEMRRKRGGETDTGNNSADFEVVAASGPRNASAAANSDTDSPCLLTANVGAGTIACAGGTTTAIVSATGGVPPYTGTGTFTVSAGPYSFTVTDSASNSSTVTGTVADGAPVTTITTRVLAYDSYTWAVDGQTYTESGSYSRVTGCQTETLLLTIVAPTGTTTITTATTAPADFTLNQGQLVAANARQNGTINGTGTLAVTGSGSIGGNGSVGNLVVSGGGRIRPGTSPGDLQANDASLGPDGVFEMEINDATGTAGADPGWDRLSVLTNVTITATSANPWVVRLTSLSGVVPGVAANFTAGSGYQWTWLTAGGSITGFDPNKFTVDTTDFDNFLGGGSFAVQQSGNALVVQFTPHTCSPSDFTTNTAPAAPAWLTLSANPPTRPTALIYIKFENPYGISNIVGLRLTNCTMSAQAYGSGDVPLGTVASVPDGWTNPGVDDGDRQALPAGTVKVVAVAAPVDANAVFSCNAQVQSLCGSSAMAQIDPVVTRLEVTGSGVVRQVFGGIPAFERHVSVENREPGLRRLEIVVNGQVYALEGLRPGESRLVDVGGAMASEEDNRIELVGEGELGAMAQVTIADSPVRVQTASGPAVYLTARLSEGGLRLSWPASASQWILQGSGGLGMGEGWRAVGPEPVWLEGRWQVEVPMESGMGLFRLIQREGF